MISLKLNRRTLLAAGTILLLTWIATTLALFYRGTRLSAEEAPLVGTWQQVSNADNVVDLRSDRTIAAPDGNATGWWKASGGKLSITAVVANSSWRRLTGIGEHTEVCDFRLDGPANQLTLSGGSIPQEMVFVRVD
jgi:hypothetical protein